MTDEKPKHKPQKKHTLDEVLKSLQDLVRGDLAAVRTAPGPGHDSPPGQSGPAASAAEADTFHDALHKLDQIITERIIEPVERARQEPPEPLLPDEELEIGWSDAVETDAAEEHPDTPTVEDIGFDTGAVLPDEEIELQPLAPDTTPADAFTTEPPLIDAAPDTAADANEQPPAEPQQLAPDSTTFEPLDESPPETPAAEPEEPPPQPPVIDVGVEPAPETVEVERVLSTENPSEEEITLPLLPPLPELTEPTDNQGTFDFTAPAPETADAALPHAPDDVDEERRTPDVAETVALDNAPVFDDTLSAPETTDAAPNADVNDNAETGVDTAPPHTPDDIDEERHTPDTAETVALDSAPAFDDTLSVEWHAGDASAPGETNVPEEQHDTGTVEPADTAEHADEGFTVEFAVEPKPPAPDEPARAESRTEHAPSAAPESTDAANASHPSEESAVKKTTPPPDDSPPNPSPPAGPGAPEGAAPPPEPRAGAPGAPAGEKEIPVLQDVADVQAPPSPPLPDVSQARDIAIRVIAKLNIERRKSGEAPLDIKTIERLQQYLADALSKRALNKSK